MKLGSKFMTKVLIDLDTNCWNWIGYTNEKGYGTIKRNGKMWKVHRYVNQTPAHLTTDHLCGNRSCVNPSHLESVTHAENMRRAAKNNYQRSKTHCPQGHEYSGYNLYVPPNKPNERHCRICRRWLHRKKYNVPESRWRK